MRILHISNAFTQDLGAIPQKIGGAEVYAQRIACALAQEGHEVIVITQRPFEGLASLFPRSREYNRVTVYSFYPLNIFSIYRTHTKPFILKAIWRLIDLVNPLPALMVWWVVRKEKPDIIHSHILHGFSPYLLLRLLSLMHIPLVQTVHSYGYLCLRCNLLHPDGIACHDMRGLCMLFVRFSRALIDNTITLVISPSHFTLALYDHFGFFPKARKRVLVNGIAIDPENPHKKKDNTFTIFFAGRLVPEKGVEMLIQAFKSVKGLNLRLDIAGEGYYERSLRNAAGDDSRIRFLGKCSWHRLKECFCASDVTVVPSIYYEVLGNVALESMSCGTPVIASRIGGLAELIEEGNNGLLFDPGDALQLQRILESIVTQPAQCEAMGRAAYLFARSFSLQLHINALQKAYTDAQKAFTRI